MPCGLSRKEQRQVLRKVWEEAEEMKAIPLEDLIILLKGEGEQIIYKEDIEDLFETYGDDWYVDEDCHDRLELCNENKRRKNRLRRIKRKEQKSDN